MTFAAEQITGKTDKGFESEWTKRGTELEPEAFDYYCMITGNEVEKVGFVYKDEKKDCGCSPDGLVCVYDVPLDLTTHFKGLEIKCPSPQVQIERLLDPKLPSQYAAQVYGSMYVTGLDEWDFLSYHPDLDHVLVTVSSSDEGCKKYFDALDTYLPLFINDVDQMVKLLRK